MGISNLVTKSLVNFILFIIIFKINFANSDGISHFDWDMAIAHGRNLTLISAGSNASMELRIPPPTNPLKMWEDPTTVWKSQAVSLLAFDPPNKVFFTMTSTDVTSVGLYDLRLNETTLLYQSHSAVTIDGLAFRAGVLYWTDTTAQVIKTMNNSRNESWESIQPIVFLKFNNQKIHGLAVDPDTGTTFWANWHTSSIEYSRNGSYETLVTGASTSQSLKIISSFIYFTNRPPGAELKIEKVNLRNRTDRTVLYRGRSLNPFSVSPICWNSVIWTDHSSRSVFIENGTSVLFYRQYSDTFPNGFIIRDLETFNQRICVLVGKGVRGPDTDKSTEVSSTRASLEFVQEVFNTSKRKLDWCGGWEGNKCMNGATCVAVDNSVFCLCRPEFSGTRCEIDSSSLMDNRMLITSSVLLTLVIILILIVTCLGWKIFKLRQKPKIRRRVILAKGNEAPSAVCEMIDIENCCNMNVCETPCYEISTNRKPTVPPGPEDKQRLIEDV